MFWTPRRKWHFYCLYKLFKVEICALIRKQGDKILSNTFHLSRSSQPPVTVSHDHVRVSVLFLYLYVWPTACLYTRMLLFCVSMFVFLFFLLSLGKLANLCFVINSKVVIYIHSRFNWIDQNYCGCAAQLTLRLSLFSVDFYDLVSLLNFRLHFSIYILSSFWFLNSSCAWFFVLCRFQKRTLRDENLARSFPCLHP